MGTCWAFATTTILEVSLLKQSIVTLADWPNPGDPNNSLISMWHLATAAGNVTNPDPNYTPSTGWQYPGWGGYNQYSVGYWTRGSGAWTVSPSLSTFTVGGGPVLTTSNPLNEFPLQRANDFTVLTADPNAIPPLPTTIPPAQQAQAYRVVQAMNFNYNGSTQGELDTYIGTLQQAILDYGALSVGINANNLSSSGENDYTKKVIYNGQETYVYHDTDASSVDHQVTIVGWDNDYEDPAHTEWGKGAWLVQNSWGTDFGKDGYFYLPYKDATAYLQPMAVIAAENAYSETVLQNQIFAPLPGQFIGRDEVVQDVSAVSKLTASEATSLQALGLWAAYDDMSVTITIYDGWVEGGNILLTMNNVELDRTGYIEISLSEAIELALNQEIYIKVDFGDGYEKPVAFDPNSLLMTGISDFSSLSWIYGYKGTDAWTDMATGVDSGDEGIFFMKGLTAVPEPSTYLLMLTGLVAVLIVRRRASS